MLATAARCVVCRYTTLLAEYKPGAHTRVNPCKLKVEQNYLLRHDRYVKSEIRFNQLAGTYFRLLSIINSHYPVQHCGTFAALILQQRLQLDKKETKIDKSIQAYS